MRGLVATLSVEGAVDTLCFDAYAEQVLGPRLRRGDVVVLDNLTAHRASRIEEVAEGRGAQVLWLAPYSPDFSPIEKCWSKIKSHVLDQLEKHVMASVMLVYSHVVDKVKVFFRKVCGLGIGDELLVPIKAEDVKRIAEGGRIIIEPVGDLATV